MTGVAEGQSFPNIEWRSFSWCVPNPFLSLTRLIREGPYDRVDPVFGTLGHPDIVIAL